MASDIPDAEKNEIAEWIKPYTLAFVWARIPNGPPSGPLPVDGSGSAFLVQKAGRKFLVTAAHVWTEMEGKLVYAVATTGQPSKIVPIFGWCTVGEPGTVRDFAIAELRNAAAIEAFGKTFANVNRLGPRRDASDPVVITGYPRNLHRTDGAGHRGAQFFHLWTRLHGDAGVPSSPAPPPADPLLDAWVGHSRMEDIEGATTDRPAGEILGDLQGVSGGSVWSVARAENGSWDSGATRLIGVYVGSAKHDADERPLTFEGLPLAYGRCVPIEMVLEAMPA